LNTLAYFATLAGQEHQVRVDAGAMLLASIGSHFLTRAESAGGQNR